MKSNAGGLHAAVAWRPRPRGDKQRARGLLRSTPPRHLSELAVRRDITPGLTWAPPMPAA